MLRTENDRGAGELIPDTTIEWIPALRAFARSLAKDVNEADDLVQDTLLKAIRHKDKFQKGTNLRAWLFTIMRNSFYNTCAQRIRESPREYDCACEIPTVSAAQESSLLGKEIVQVVQALPPSYRKTFILVALLGESYEKCAQICKVEIGTIKSRVNRARAMVMERLEAPKSAQLTGLTSESGRTYGSSNRTP